MAKITLLEIVQQILSDSDGDDVNSITDTIESDQCARVVRDAFQFTVDNKDVQYLKTLKQLTATSGTTPNVMTRPTGFHSIEWIRYDKKTSAGGDQKLQYVDWVDPDTFLTRIAGRATSDSNVTAVTLSTGLVIPIINDRAPTFYTVMDEGSDDLVFDSYDSALETNLQASKSMAYGMLKPSLTLTDAETMDLPEHLEQLVITEAKAMYFDLYKDGVTSEIDRRRRRQEVRSQRQRNIIKNTDNDNRPDYGRK
jgi:hypothetical protein